ncbi:hypothetical protein GJAV_G00059870 [Gymnothorax javanicus]|nr:hypothetical protein GJAV_G00059870 [Gymnothorax javanicus]
MVCIAYICPICESNTILLKVLEKPEEARLRSELSTLKAEFLNHSCINITSLENFMERVLSANKYGVSVLYNSSESSNWDLASSLFFANTLVTTVGYGHTTPLSDAGKAFSIIYALLGVPFTMLVLTVCVHRLMHLFTYWPINLCQRRLGCVTWKAATVHFVVLLVVVVLCFLVVPAVVFSSIEETWSFLDAIYFCFISLCTIGLGDYVPGEQRGQKLRPLYKISVMVYLFVGLMFMLLVLRAFHKLADMQGLTAFLQLSNCEEEEEDREPIVATGPNDQPHTFRASSRPLDPSSQVSYNSINR